MQWSLLFLPIVFASPTWLHLQVLHVLYLLNRRIVLHKAIVCVLEAVPIVTSFHVSFRALHSNSIDRGSNDGS